MLFFCLSFRFIVCFFFKQKTAYEMRISDWSSDVCSSDLAHGAGSTMIRSTVGRPANGPSVPGRSVAGMPEAGAGQQRVGLGQRQADDVRVGSVEEGHVGGRQSLDGIAAGLAVPFAGRQVGRDLAILQPLEADPGLEIGRAHV